MSSDPHTGGRLEDMAAEGTTMPNDAGKMNIIPSVPRPDQKAEDPAYSQQGLGSGSLTGAVDNGTDIPRTFTDTGATGGVITGTGDQLPPQVESKRLHFSPNNPAAKGHDRDDKHRVHNRHAENPIERMAGDDGADMAPPPGEEEDDQQQIRDRHDANLK